MARKLNMEVLDEVKNEPICYTKSISQNKQENKVKEERIDQQEIKAEEEEKFMNRSSIAFLNEETNKLQKSK